MAECHTSQNAITIPGSKSFWESLETLRGRPSLPMSENPYKSHCIRTPSWIPSRILFGLEPRLEKRPSDLMCLPHPSSHQDDFLMITEQINTASGLPSPKAVSGDFSAPDFCWYRLSAPNCSFSFLESIHQSGCTQHVTDPTRRRDILGSISTIGLANVQTSAKTGFFGRDHLPVRCPFTLPLLNRHPIIQCRVESVTYSSPKPKLGLFFSCTRNAGVHWTLAQVL